MIYIKFNSVKHFPILRHVKITNLKFDRPWGPVLSSTKIKLLTNTTYAFVVSISIVLSVKVRWINLNQQDCTLVMYPVRAIIIFDSCV